ncbi:MAG: hypothetical protein ACE5GE_06655, partial [Phycisphaerae bacterium]
MVSAGVVRAVKAAIVLGLAAVWMPGCGSADTGQSSAVLPGPQPLGLDGRSGRTAAGGDPFAQALTWPIVQDQPATVTSELISNDQVDVYDVGAVYGGDHLRVEVDGLGSLNAAVAVFDADRNVIVANDDRSFYGGLVDPLADALISRDSDRCYVAVSVSPRGSIGGTYTLKVELTQDTPANQPQPQRVYLNFDGAQNVVIGTRTPVVVPAFDAGDISPSLSNDSREIMEMVVDLVSEDYT